MHVWDDHSMLEASFFILYVCFFLGKSLQGRLHGGAAVEGWQSVVYVRLTITKAEGLLGRMLFRRLMLTP